MCGRYAAFREAQDLADAFDVDDLAPDAAALPPSWNVAPTDPVRVVVERRERVGSEPTGPVRRSLRLARWGLVPGWAQDPSIGARLINARVESLATKPAFRRALAARRCLVPADGWYEWTAPPPEAPRGPRQPHWITRSDGGPLAFAGLYEFWRDPARAEDDPLRWLVSATVVTGDAAPAPAVAALHDRRPVVLPPERWAAWLDPEQGAEAAMALLAVAPPPLRTVTVSTEVNRVTANGPGLITPVG